MDWDKFKDFYDSSTATNFGKISCILLIIALGTSGWYVEKHANSRRFFKCNTTKANKDFLEAECFDQYSHNYVDKFPPVVFVGLYLFLLVVMVVNTVFALRRVMTLREYKTDLSSVPPQIKSSMEASFAVFVFYVIQVTLRILTLAAFIGLQWTLRPKILPPTYECDSKTPVYCKDDFYKQFAILNYVSSSFNAAIIVSSVVELMQVLIKCCSSPRRLNNFEFSAFLLHIKHPQGDDEEQELLSNPEFSTMDAYRDRLVQQYLGSMSQVNIKPWNPEDTIHINEIYTRVSWVHQEKTTKGSKENSLKDYCDIFSQSNEHHQKPKRLLVQGKAGIGKSTFSSKLAVDWAGRKKEVLKGFHLLIVLRLREVYSVSTLAEALQKCLGFEQSEAEEIIQYMGDNPEKVLLLFDGLDEYDITQSSEVMEIIHGRKLPGCSMIVTARPWMGEKIRKHIHAQFQIMGFNWDDIKKYATRHFDSEEEIDSFVKYLQKKRLSSLAEIPLLLLFLCLLWKERKWEGLPSSRAELYKEIIQCIIHHHNAKSNTISCNALDENTELLTRMGKIACNALQRNSLIFSYQDLAQDEQSSEILSLGLLSISKAPTRNPNVMVSFLHKSVQEFLAAFYIISLMQSQEKEAEVRDIMNDLQLTFSNPFSAKCQLWYSENVVHFICELSDTGSVQVFNKLCHMRKSKENKKQLSLQEFSDCDPSYSYMLCTFHDMCLELYMSRSNRKEEVDTALVNCLNGFIVSSSIKIFEIKKLVSLLAKGNFRGIVLHETFLSNQFKTRCNIFLKELEVKIKQPGSAEQWPSANKLFQKLLEIKAEFTLWVQKEDDDTFCLLQYDILRYKVDRQAMLDIITMCPEGLYRLCCDLDTVITRVPFEKLQRLRKLRLRGQLLTAEIVHKVCVALPSMTRLERLQLYYSDIGDTNMLKVIQQLQYVTQLCELDLSGTGMDSTSGRALVESLQHTRLLEKLTLSHNPLGDDWLDSLSQHLHNVPHLRKLELSSTNMTERGARAVSGALHCVPQLEELDLSFNPLGDGGVSSVIQNLANTPHLQKLDLSDTGVTMSGAAAESLALPRLPQLKYLTLSLNSLCDTAVQALAGSLYNVPQLEFLNLSRNPLCDAAVQALADSLYNVPQLGVLDLSETQMTGEGLKALAGGLHHTPKLRLLGLSHNRCITDSEAWRKLAAELRLILVEKFLVLHLKGCTITEPVLAELRGLSRVKVVYCDNDFYEVREERTSSIWSLYDFVFDSDDGGDDDDDDETE